MPPIGLLASKLSLSLVGLFVASLGMPPTELLAPSLSLGPVGLLGLELRLVSKGGRWSCGWGLGG